MSVSQRLYLKNCILKISGDSRCRLSPLNDFYCLVQRCNFWAVESLFSLTVAAQNIRVCYPRQKLQYLRLLFYQILKLKAIARWAKLVSSLLFLQFMRPSGKCFVGDTHPPCGLPRGDLLFQPRPMHGGELLRLRHIA